MIRKLQPSVSYGRGHWFDPGTAHHNNAEATRCLLRARLGGRLSVEEERAAIRWLRSFRRSCDAMSITESVLVRAGRPYPVETIRTFDAIHLATRQKSASRPS